MGHIDVRPFPTLTAPYPQVRLTPTLMLLVTGAVALALDLIFFTGYYVSDDNEYLSGARLILETGRLPAEPMLGQKRLALVGWNLLIAAVFGYKVTLIAASYLLFHQGLIVGTYLLGRRMFDWQTGILAAWYVATLPIIVAFSSTILPDIPIACFTVLALWCFQTAYQRADAGRGSGALWTFLAGLCVGIVYLIKEFGLILLPFFFFVWLLKEWKRRGWVSVWRGAMFPLGFALLFGGEYVVLSWLTGKPFLRLEWTSKPEELPTWLQIKLRDRSFMRRYNWMRTETHRFMYPIPARAVWLVCLLIFPFLKRGAMSILLLGAWIFAYLTWGSMSLSTYLPPSIQGRYYIPVTPFLILTAAAVIVAGVRALLARFPAARRAILAVVVGGLIVWPFMDLRGVDLFAGNNYNAPMYGNVMKAFQQAEAQRDRPIVLCGLLSSRLGEALRAGRPANLLLADELTPAEVQRMIDQGGFYFIDAYRNSVFALSVSRQRAPEACPLDAEIHAAVWHEKPSPRLAISSMGKVRSLVSRRAELSLELFHEPDLAWADYLVRRSRMSMSALSADIRQGGFDPLYFTVQLYDVKPPPPVSDSLLWLATRGRVLDFTPRVSSDGALTGWTLTAGASPFELDAVGGDEPAFRMSSADSTVRLESPAAGGRLRVPAGHRGVVVVRASGDASAWASVFVRATPDGARGDDEIERQAVLRQDGLLVADLPADSRAREVRVTMTLRGQGVIRVESCTLLVEPAPPEEPS